MNTDTPSPRRRPGRGEGCAIATVGVVDAAALQALQAELERLHGTPYCLVVRTEAGAAGLVAEVAVLRRKREPPGGRVLTVFLVDSDFSGSVVEQVADRTLGPKWKRGPDRRRPAARRHCARK